MIGYLLNPIIFCYKGTYSGVCDFKKRKTRNVLTKAKLTKMESVRKGDRNLEKVLAFTVVGVKMDLHGDIMYYKNGNYEAPYHLCRPTHAASLVGYGTNEWGRYWKVRSY